MRNKTVKWDLLEIHCESHVNALVHKEVALHHVEHISEMLNFSLSLQFTADLNLFRQCIVAVAAPKVRIRRGPPPERFELYRRVALRNLLVNTKSEQAKRAACLSMLPNGDWTDPENIDVWVLHDADITDEKEFAQGVAVTISRSLVYKRYGKYTLASGTVWRSQCANKLWVTRAMT